jgi:hypothetical protein
VPGAEKATYDPGIIDQNTYYVRCARSFGCCKFGESNIVGFRIDNASECENPKVNSNIIKDCENNITLTAPSDNLIDGKVKEYHTNMAIDANTLNHTKSSLLLNGKLGIELKPGFAVDTSAILIIQVDGCN